ncbi:MAG: tetratricopeptide repeat protein [Candidatus Neomarinimicrobiota bacterium]
MAVFYGGIAFVIVQIIDGAFSYLHIPEWVGTALILLLLAGFPVAMILAWIFDITPEGIVRTQGAIEGSQPTRRPLTRNHIIAIAALVVVAAAGSWWRWGQATVPAVLPRTVAVLPFSVQGSDDLSFLSHGMVDLFSTKLDGAGSWRSVDPRAVLGLIQREGEGVPDPSRGEVIAKTLHAGYYLLGNIVAVGNRLRLDATLYGREAGPATSTKGTAEGDASEIFEMVDQVVTQMLVGQSGGPRTRFRRVAGMTTSSLSAFKAYLEGESALRAGHFQAALDAYQLALAQDSLFALAYYRLSVAAEWLTREKLSRDAAEEALRHAERLSERDRRLLEALLLQRQGAHNDAKSLYRSIVGAYPDDIEAWFQLGEVLFHTNGLSGHSHLESREAFERVLSLEPEHATALLHLARLSANEVRLSELDSLLVEFGKLSPSSDRQLEMLALQVFAHGDRTQEDQALTQLRRASDLALALAVWSVTTWTADLRRAESIAHLMIEPSRSVEARRVGYVVLAHLKLAQGRWSAAKNDLDALAAFEPAMALEYKALLSSLPFLHVENEQLAFLRTALEQLDTAAIPPSNNPSTFFNVHDGLHHIIKAYLIGLLDVRLGEPHKASQRASQLESLPIPLVAGTLGADLANSISSQVQLLQGHTDEALQSLERIRTEMWYHLTFASPFCSQAYERFGRAELLREVGRDREALRWYGSLVSISVYEQVYRPLAHLRQGEIYQRLGEYDQAARHYARFIELWKDCDPELRPMLDDAKERLAALEASTS